MCHVPESLAVTAYVTTSPGLARSGVTLVVQVASRGTANLFESSCFGAGPGSASGEVSIAGIADGSARAVTPNRPLPLIVKVASGKVTRVGLLHDFGSQI